MVSLSAQSINLTPEPFVRGEAEELPWAQFEERTYTFILMCREIAGKSWLCINMKLHIEQHNVKTKTR